MDGVRQVVQLTAQIATGRAAHELGHFVAGEPAQPETHDVVGSPEVGQGVRQCLGHVGLGVAEGGEQQHTGVSGSAR